LAPALTEESTMAAKAGQVWEDTYDYRISPEAAREQGFVQPALEVTETDGKPGGFACGIRRPSGRKTRVRLNDKGEPRGYRLKE
jgi:hypothetical protein